MTTAAVSTRAEYWFDELHQGLRIAGAEHLTMTHRLQQEMHEEAIMIFTDLMTATPENPGRFEKSELFVFNDGSGLLHGDCITPNEVEGTFMRTFDLDVCRSLTKQIQKGQKMISCFGRRLQL